METPIFRFVQGYCSLLNTRLHMPGHKGVMLLGMESMDITEIPGADDLYHPTGIIAESEANASALFGCPTVYSTEGSSQCIRAMLYLLALHTGRRPVVAAARNVHKTFLSAAALLDLDVRWIWPRQDDSYLSCRIDSAALDSLFATEKHDALYITSPDYLGHVADIPALAEVCHRHGVLLIVDNAHGAYLRFLKPSQHPIDLGADICCDSAHKTLPALTGAAYLHISPTAPEIFLRRAKDAMAMFGSTSPSYLILQSLDLVNHCLDTDFPKELTSFQSRIKFLRKELVERGWDVISDEPMKLSLRTKSHGFTGTQLLRILADEQVICEFADADYLVMMFSPKNSDTAIEKIRKHIVSLPKFRPIRQEPPTVPPCEQVLSIREAMLRPSRRVCISEAVGCILAEPGISCPPAVPILVCGERISKEAVAAFEYYGITHCEVVDDSVC